MLIHSILNAIEHTVIKYGATGIFAGVFLEELISILPSFGVVTLSGSIFLAGQKISFGSIFYMLIHISIPAALGMTLGSLFLYSLIYAFGEKVIDRFGRFARISWRDIQKLQKLMRGHKHLDLFILFLIRAIPIIPFSVSNAFCGLVKWPIIPFVVVSFFGAVVRNSIFAFTGWQLGRLYHKHIAVFEKFEVFVVIVIAAVAVAFVVYRYIKHKDGGIDLDIEKPPKIS